MLLSIDELAVAVETDLMAENGRDGQENIWRLAFWTVAGGEGCRVQPLEGCKTDLILKVAVVS